jgi:hypothetical protein
MLDKFPILEWQDINLLWGRFFSVFKEMKNSLFHPVPLWWENQDLGSRAKPAAAGVE